MPNSFSGNRSSISMAAAHNNLLCGDGGRFVGANRRRRQDGVGTGPIGEGCKPLSQGGTAPCRGRDDSGVHDERHKCAHQSHVTPLELGAMPLRSIGTFQKHFSAINSHTPSPFKVGIRMRQLMDIRVEGPQSNLLDISGRMQHSGEKKFQCGVQGDQVEPPLQDNTDFPSFETKPLITYSFRDQSTCSGSRFKNTSRCAGLAVEWAQ